MAKEKNNTDDFMSKVKDEINKTYNNIIFDSNVNIIKTGLNAYDKFVGGVPVGKMILIQSLEGVGKSSLAVQIAGQYQKEGYSVVYLDTESAMSSSRFKELNFDIKNPKTFYIQPTTLQIVFNIILDIIKLKQDKDKNNEPTLIVWDSLAATPALEEIEKPEINGQETAIRARIVSQGLRIITSMLSKSNITLLIVNQYRMKMSTMPAWGGPQYTTPGGNAPRFHAFYIVELKDGKKSSEDDMGEDAGKLVRVKTLKNKFLPPLVEFSMYYSYKNGFDNIWTSYYTLKDAKIIKTAGPWMFLENYTDVKFHKLDFKNFYLNNPEFAKKVDEAIESLKTTISDSDEVAVDEEITTEEDINTNGDQL